MPKFDFGGAALERQSEQEQLGKNLLGQKAENAVSESDAKKDISEECKHDYEWTVTKEATCGDHGQRVGVCKKCGNNKAEVIYPTKKHKWDEGVVTLQPTAKKSGRMTYTCTVCGKEKTEDIPAIKVSKHPLTIVIAEDVYRGLQHMKIDTGKDISRLVEEWYMEHASK